jgi:hypothetical protein
MSLEGFGGLQNSMIGEGIKELLWKDVLFDNY